jgi:diacylglycerol kinase (ATP)
MSYSFKKQLKSFTFAWKGILTCAGHEQNITFHLIAAIIVLAQVSALASHVQSGWW